MFASMVQRYALSGFLSVTQITSIHAGLELEALDGVPVPLLALALCLDAVAVDRGRVVEELLEAAQQYADRDVDAGHFGPPYT